MGLVARPRAFERWFDRILVNTCRNRLRAMSRRRFDQLTDELPVAATDPFEQLHERGALWPAIERLTPDQRVVLTLRFYQDFSIDEIAVRLGMRPGTVKSRLHRTLRDLRFTLREIEQTRIDR